jgi:YD repeat-containing protein
MRLLVRSVGECAVFTCDYDDFVFKFDNVNNVVIDDGYFDKENGWNKGGGCELTENQSYLHYGKKVLRVHMRNLNMTGPGIWLMGIEPNKMYTYSACVKIAPGSSNPSMNVTLDGDDPSSPENVGTASSYPMRDLDDGWKFIYRTFKTPNDDDPSTRYSCYISLSGRDGTADFYIDDIRFHPSKSLVSTYYYDHNQGLPITFVDANNNAVYFKYDEFSRVLEKGVVKK